MAKTASVAFVISALLPVFAAREVARQAQDLTDAVGPAVDGSAPEVAALPPVASEAVSEAGQGEEARRAQDVAEAVGPTIDDSAEEAASPQVASESPRAEGAGAACEQLGDAAACAASACAWTGGACTERAAEAWLETCLEAEDLPPWYLYIASVCFAPLLLLLALGPETDPRVNGDACTCKKSFKRIIHLGLLLFFLYGLVSDYRKIAAAAARAGSTEAAVLCGAAIVSSSANLKTAFAMNGMYQLYHYNVAWPRVHQTRIDFQFPPEVRNRHFYTVWGRYSTGVIDAIYQSNGLTAGCLAWLALFYFSLAILLLGVPLVLPAVVLFFWILLPLVGVASLVAMWLCVAGLLLKRGHLDDPDEEVQFRLVNHLLREPFQIRAMYVQLEESQRSKARAKLLTEPKTDQTVLEEYSRDAEYFLHTGTTFTGLANFFFSSVAWPPVFALASLLVGHLAPVLLDDRLIAHGADWSFLWEGYRGAVVATYATFTQQHWHSYVEFLQASVFATLDFVNYFSG